MFAKKSVVLGRELQQLLRRHSESACRAPTAPTCRSGARRSSCSSSTLRSLDTKPAVSGHQTALGRLSGGSSRAAPLRHAHNARNDLPTYRRKGKLSTPEGKNRVGSHRGRLPRIIPQAYIFPRSYGEPTIYRDLHVGRRLFSPQRANRSQGASLGRRRGIGRGYA